MRVKCKLYLVYKDRVIRIGEFRSREAAEAYYIRYRRILEETHGPHHRPVYVQNGKGK